MSGCPDSGVVRTPSVVMPSFANVPSKLGNIPNTPEKHPLYAALTSEQPKAAGEGDEFREKLRGYGMTPTEEPEVLWNFEKFLIAKDGSVAARFAPGTTPDDPALVSAIEAELAK